MGLLTTDAHKCTLDFLLQQVIVGHKLAEVETSFLKNTLGLEVELVRLFCVFCSSDYVIDIQGYG